MMDLLDAGEIFSRKFDKASNRAYELSGLCERKMQVAVNNMFLFEVWTADELLVLTQTSKIPGLEPTQTTYTGVKAVMEITSRGPADPPGPVQIIRDFHNSSGDYRTTIVAFESLRQARMWALHLIGVASRAEPLNW